MARIRQNMKTLVVSFSGIDGAGKSTQIDALAAHLAEGGRRVRLIRFWDDVARLKAMREKSGRAIFEGDQGVGSPSAPIHRRDKNVRSGLMTCVRLFLYFVDAISVRLAVAKALRSGTDVVIFDRYTWDELANLNLRNPLVRSYIRFLLLFVPRPHISYLLDAHPVQARLRKPEYPLEFVIINRQSYLTLAWLIGGITVIPPMPIPDVTRQMVQIAQGELARLGVPAVECSRPSTNRTEAGVSKALGSRYSRPAPS